MHAHRQNTYRQLCSYVNATCIGSATIMSLHLAAMKCMLTAALTVGQGYAKSKDGFELHMATNYLGPFLLTMLLFPSLQRSGTPVRICAVSSSALLPSWTCCHCA